MVLLELVSFYTATTLAGCPFKALHGSVDSQMLPPRHAPIKDEPDPLTQTYQGCKCKSACGATADFGQASCDWCYTDGNCGHFSLTRLAHYDYCVYRSDLEWEKSNAEKKLIDTWKKVIEDETPGSYPVIDFANIFVESVQTTFDNEWDYMPAGRKKMIHSVGMVCPVHFDVTLDKYTGVFQKGTQDAFLRLGSALVVNIAGGVVPGIGMKFFRDGTHSANYVTLHSLDPHWDYNMFAYNQSNHIATPPAYAIALGEKFKQASTCITMVGLSDACTWTQDGKKVANPVFPYKIEYRPTGEATMSSMPSTGNTLLENMIKGAPSGTRLYDVWAWESPKATPVKMGSITNTQDCVSSKYGDEKMFFRHQRIEEDWQLRPEWIPDINAQLECGISEITTTPPADCSTYTGEGPCNN